MKKCILIAPLVSHASSGRIAALVNTSYDISLIDISRREVTFNINQYPYDQLKKIYYLGLPSIDRFYNHPNHLTIIKDTVRSYNILSENKLLSSAIRRIIDDVRPDIIVTYYGPAGLHFSRIIKKIDMNFPVVFIPNLVPSSIMRTNLLWRALKKPLTNEFIDYAKWINKIDTIICASNEMSDFLNKKFSYHRERMRILPDYLPKRFHVQDKFLVRDVQVNKQPRVIFLGAPERWGNVIDNLDDEFSSLTNAGVQVCCGVTGALSSVKTPWDHYPYFTDDDVFSGKLSNYAHQYDAALITYNISDRHERFRSTLPTRFFSSLAAGLPIAVKKGIFDAVETFVENYNIGFAYEDGPGLLQLLKNQRLMNDYRKNICNLMHDFCAESQSLTFEKLLDDTLTNVLK